MITIPDSANAANHTLILRLQNFWVLLLTPNKLPKNALDDRIRKTLKIWG